MGRASTGRGPPVPARAPRPGPSLPRKPHPHPDRPPVRGPPPPSRPHTREPSGPSHPPTRGRPDLRVLPGPNHPASPEAGTGPVRLPAPPESSTPGAPGVSPRLRSIGPGRVAVPHSGVDVPAADHRRPEPKRLRHVTTHPNHRRPTPQLESPRHVTTHPDHRRPEPQLGFLRRVTTHPDRRRQQPVSRLAVSGRAHAPSAVTPPEYEERALQRGVPPNTLHGPESRDGLAAVTGGPFQE